MVRGKRCQGEECDCAQVLCVCVFVIHSLPFMSSSLLGLRKVHKETVPKMAREEEPSRGAVCVYVCE